MMRSSHEMASHRLADGFKHAPLKSKMSPLSTQTSASAIARQRRRNGALQTVCRTSEIGYRANLFHGSVVEHPIGGVNGGEQVSAADAPAPATHFQAPPDDRRGTQGQGAVN